MTEPIDQSGSGTGTSDQPSGEAQTPDIEALVSSAVTKALGGLDDRFAGFQSLIDKKISPLSQQMSQLKTALSPEEQEQLDADGEKAELAELRRRNALLELRKDHPKEVDFFMQVMDAETLDDQIAVIAKFLGPAVAAQVEEAAEEAADKTVPEVDRNSPARSKPASALLAGHSEMTDEIAEAILKTGGKGALVKGR